jgi:hypothetical protein
MSSTPDAGRTGSNLPLLVQLLLKEYDSLRDEIKLSMQTRSQILSFGFATETALIGAAGLSQVVSHGTGTRAVIILTCFAIPGLSLMILALWLGEFVRMARAGAHVAWLEARINGVLSQGPYDLGRVMTWEQSRWHAKSARITIFEILKPRLLVDAYAPIGLSFVALILFSPFAGMWVVNEPMGNYMWVSVVGLLFVSYLVWRFTKYVKIAGRQARQPDQPPQEVIDVWEAQLRDARELRDTKRARETA